MAFNLVQSKTGSGTGTSLAITFNSNNTAGNMILVTAYGWVSTPNVMTDSRGNTYIAVSSGSAATNPYKIWAAMNIAGGSNTITLTGLSSGWPLGAIITEYSGQDPLGTPTVGTQGSGTGGVANSGSITVPAVGDLLVAFAYSSNNITMTNSSGYGDLIALPASNNSLGQSAKTTTASGSQTASITSGAGQNVSIVPVSIPALAMPGIQTDATSSINKTTATANGTITAEGASAPDIRGFVYDTTSRSDPGNVAPASTSYANNATTSGTYSTGSFTASLTGLTKNTTYYIRAVAHNSIGYKYGAEVSFTTLPGTPLIDALSGVDTGFTDLTDGADTSPFDSGDSIQYTVQSALSNGVTYYWRVRARDPAGTNTWSSWSSTRDFNVSSNTKTRTHTTSANKKVRGTTSHTTSANKRKATTASHTTSSYLKGAPNKFVPFAFESNAGYRAHSNTTWGTLGAPMLYTAAHFDNTPQVYIESSFFVQTGPGTSRIRLFDLTANAEVGTSSDYLTTTSGTMQTQRGTKDFGPLLVDGHQYRLEVNNLEASDVTYVQSADIIFIQGTDTTFTKLAQYIPLNNLATGITSTSYVYPQYPDDWLYEADKFSGTTTFYYEAGLANDGGAATTYSELYDVTAGASVSGSEVSKSGTAWLAVRSGPLTLIDGHTYRVRGKVSASTGQILNSHLYMTQSGSITKTQVTRVPSLNDWFTNVNTATGDPYPSTFKYVASDYAGLSGDWNYELMLSTASGTGIAQPYNRTAGTTFGTAVTTTSSTLTRFRGAIASMPADGSFITIENWSQSGGAQTVDSAGRRFILNASLGVQTLTTSHSTSANKRKAANTLSHTTNALKEARVTISHTTSAFKRQQFTKTHTTNALLRKQFTRTHTTDALKRAQTTKSHTTSANKRKLTTVAHTTDAFKRQQFTRSHTTSAFLRTGFTKTHTTDAVKRAATLRSHTTSAVKRAITTKFHTTDAYKRQQFLRTHTTNANKRKALTVFHTTSANKRKPITVFHTTSANKRVSGTTRTHTTDAFKRLRSTLSHTTDARLFQLIFQDLVDNFDNGVADTSKWSGTYTESGGHANFYQDYYGGTYIRSAQKRSIIGNQLYFQYFPNAFTFASQIFYLAPTDFSDFIIRLDHSEDNVMRLMNASYTVLASWSYVSGYDWIRFRESGGTFYVDTATSPSSTWVNRYSGSTLSGLNNAYFYAQAGWTGGSGGGKGGGGTDGWIDNFNSGLAQYTLPHTTDTLLRRRIDTIGGGTSIFYFDGHSGITDPSNAWGSDSNAFNGDFSTGGGGTYAYMSTGVEQAGSKTSLYLQGIGTTASGIGTISQVRFRIKKGYASAVLETSGTVYSGAEELGTITLSGSTADEVSSWYTLSTPTGGWDWTKAQELTIRFYGYEGELYVARVAGAQIEVTSLAPFGHTTNAFKRKQNVVSHTTSSNKKKASNTLTHTTSTVKRRVFTATHTTDALKKVRGTPSHTTNALKRAQNVRTHTTDALKRIAFTRSHTTSANKRKLTTVFHTTDANKRTANLTRSHTTNALKRSLNTLSHTTDALKEARVTLSHTTNSFLRRQLALSHTTNANLRKATLRSHTTDANKRKLTVLSHTTNANKRKANNLVSHTTDAFKRTLITRSHTTDSFLRRQLTLFHSTNALKRKAFTLSHTTDANKKKAATVFHTTSANKKKAANLLTHTTDALKKTAGLTRTHTTDALKRSLNTRSHTTDSFLRKANTRSHTTDSFLRSGATVVHSTDANKRKATVVSHTTSSNKRKANTLTHTTNSLLRKQGTLSHTTNALKRQRLALSHSTNAFLRRQIALAHTTNANKRRATTVFHTTNANKRRLTLVSHNTDANKRKLTTVSHTTSANLRKAFVASHSTDALKRVTGITRSHTTDANKRKFTTVSHSTDAFKRSLNVLSHSTDALKRSANVLSHTTDTLKRTETAVSHTTDAFLRTRRTLAHSTDAYKRKGSELVHTTDALKKTTNNQLTHTTDTVKRIANIVLTHTTDANKRKTTVIAHTTDTLKRKQFLKTHTTNALKRKATTRTHTTNALKKRACTRTHTTNSLLRKALWRSHTTDANKKKANVVQHATDALKRTRSALSHTTDANKKRYQEISHSTDANLKRAGELVFHSTDAFIRGDDQVVHNTDANKRRADNTVDHTTDASKYQAFTKSHTTSSVKRKAITRTHTTDANKRKSFTVSHSTNALLRKRSILTHTTSSVKRKATVAFHTTNANKRKAGTVFHTTNALKRQQTLRSHTTDALLRQRFVSDHTTDAFLRKAYTITHSTDANKKAAGEVSHTTDASLFAPIRRTHTTDANLYWLKGRKHVLVDGHWKACPVLVLVGGVWIVKNVYWFDDPIWRLTSQ